MTEIWSRLPGPGVLFDRCKHTAGYRNGNRGRGLNPKYLELMKERGLATKVSIRGLSEATVARQTSPRSQTGTRTETASLSIGGRRGFNFLDRDIETREGPRLERASI